MKYYSLNKQSPITDFRQATILGQAPDKGLYFPEKIPTIDRLLLDRIEELSNQEIAYRVIQPYVGKVISEEKLLQIVSETVNFDLPLVSITNSISALELFHGPTLAFKDVGARFMSRCLGAFVEKENKAITVLVATSGDTGGAVADGFYGVEGIEVVILYPSGKVSPVQEQQLTAMGGNIHALEVKGSFDDCQLMVKEAFADEAIKRKRFLTSANSINIARWLPQQFYYFFSYKQWKGKETLPVICVPSGNFGNMCAGMLAYKSGLPVSHFIAACNSNDVILRFLQTQSYEARAAIPTYSNAMDVGNPSNFIRILELFENGFPALKKMLSAYSITDDETAATIRTVHEQFGYTLDPHGAVGFAALHHYLSHHPQQKGLFLETAHPVKFPDIVEAATGEKLTIPPRLNQLMQKPKKSILIEPGLETLKAYLLA